MKGDFTRLSFDKEKHYRGVLMQQGRVQLDSDWNEQVEIAEHRYSSFFGDLVGQSGAPAENGMKVSMESSKAITLGEKTFISADQFPKSLTSVTIGLWFRATTFPEVNRCILDLDGIAGFGLNEHGISLVRWGVKNWELVKDAKMMADNCWHFLAAIITRNELNDETSYITFLDGKQVDDRSSKRDKRLPLLKTLTIGTWLNAGLKTDYFGGDVAELMVWELPTKPVPPLAGLTGKEKGLIRYYPFDDNDPPGIAVDHAASRKDATIKGEVKHCDGPYKSGKVTLSKGRYYVDGLLVENEDEVIMPDLSANGLYLAYLDVWTGHVSAAEDDNLREPALGGPDTTTRIKTEWLARWQNVSYLKDQPDEIGKRYRGAWPQLSAPSHEDFWQLPLSTGQMAVASTKIQVNDNRLYRVEVHSGNRDQSGKTIPPVFKWSRDNGSVVAPVKKIDANAKTINIANTGLNMENAFSGATLVEVCDGQCNSTGSPGCLVGVVMGLSDDKNEIIFKYNDWTYDRDPSELAEPIIVRRWDGKSSAYDFDLEGGLHVNFTDKTAFYRSGDYWLVPTRSGNVIDWEEGVPQSPHGVEHHFASLALVSKLGDKLTLDASLSVIFQPLISGNVSKLGDTIDGDLCVLGRVSVGSGFFNAPLSLAAANDGKIASIFQDNMGAEAWRISQGSGNNLSLSITDHLGNGLTILSGGNVGIGTTNPDKAKLEVSGMIGNTVGMFGKDATGISLVANWPTIGFNAYYDGKGWRSMAAGWAGDIHINQDDGSMGFRTVSKKLTADEQVNFADQLMIGSNGNVGIGTQNLWAKLNVSTINTGADLVHGMVVDAKCSGTGDTYGLRVSLDGEGSGNKEGIVSFVSGNGNKYSGAFHATSSLTDYAAALQAVALGSGDGIVEGINVQATSKGNGRVSGMRIGATCEGRNSVTGLSIDASSKANLEDGCILSGLKVVLNNHEGTAPVYGICSAVAGSGKNKYAGYFIGNVHIEGIVDKTGGSFLIDHPLDPHNKTLRHSFVESPEDLCLYRGKAVLDEHGVAKVNMPDYFSALTKEEEATVTLTAIGKKPFLASYIWNKKATSFTIYGEAGGEVSYLVLADRDDPAIRLLRRPVEENKGDGHFELGKLLNPEAYGERRETRPGTR
jgi:hypothetical protein